MSTRKTTAAKRGSKLKVQETAKEETPETHVVHFDKETNDMIVNILINNPDFKLFLKGFMKAKELVNPKCLIDVKGAMQLIEQK